MGVSPVLGMASSSVQAAPVAHAKGVNNTYGKNSRVEMTKTMKFVDRNGKKTSKTATKGGKYTIWNVKTINGQVYYSIQTDLKYWIPASATQGTVTYKSGNTTYTLKSDGKKVTTTTSTAKKSTAKKTTKTTKSNTSSKKTSTKTSTKSNGTTKIKGVLYYSLGNNAYIKAANVVGGANASSSSKTTTSTKKSTTSKTTSTKKTSTKKDSDMDAIKVKLIHNAYVYDQNGKRIKKYNGKTKLTKGTTVNTYGTDTINGKDYYQLNAAGTAFVKASNVDSTSSVTITMKKNAYIYDGNGDTEKKTVKKGKKVKATEARYIGTKLYYKIGDDQFVKAANVGKVSSKLDPVNEPDGSATVDDNSSYDTNLNASIVTTTKVAPLYDIKGQADSTRSFGAGQKQQVSELRYIATSANSTPELFYKLASGRGYLKATDVIYSGKTLSPVNTPEQALTEVTVATTADKAKLTPSINEANAIKNTDAYKLASSSAKSAYDKAITDATAVNNNASATVAQVNEAIANITSAKAKLDGKKVTVANLSNLTPDEVSAIVKLVASVNNVPESNVQFTNNNTTLAIVTNGYTQALNINDYAQVGTTTSNN